MGTHGTARNRQVGAGQRRSQGQESKQKTQVPRKPGQGVTGKTKTIKHGTWKTKGMTRTYKIQKLNRARQKQKDKTRRAVTG